jgi:hypothetical protein
VGWGVSPIVQMRLQRPRSWKWCGRTGLQAWVQLTCEPHQPLKGGDYRHAQPGSSLHSPDTLDVRLGFSLCPAELEFLQKRKLVVAEALKQVLQLEEDLPEDEVGKMGPLAWALSHSGPCWSFQPQSLPATSALPCPRAAPRPPHFCDCSNFSGSSVRVRALPVCSPGQGRAEDRGKEGLQLFLPSAEQQSPLLPPPLDSRPATYPTAL